MKRHLAAAALALLLAAPAWASSSTCAEFHASTLEHQGLYAMGALDGWIAAHAFLTAKAESWVDEMQGFDAVGRAEDAEIVASMVAGYQLAAQEFKAAAENVSGRELGAQVARICSQHPDKGVTFALLVALGERTK